MQHLCLTGVVLVGTIGLVSVGYAKTGGGYGGGLGGSLDGGQGGGFMGTPGTVFGVATDSSMVPITSGFRLIPSMMMVGERYDNNVLFQAFGNNGFLIERQVVQVSLTQAFY